MRFGVLGPLEVWTADGRPVRVPELKVRALLAALLAGDGRPVPADRLVEDLWGADPPGKPGGVLRSKVSQLRRALAEAEPDARTLVVHRAPGYLLRLGGDGAETDAQQFTELVTRARAQPDPRAQSAVLAEALALWRGAAYADFADEQFARPAVARLTELRLTALEEQAQARLALGEHSLLAGELADLIEEHPLRERLRAVHMRALYGAGRAGEALASFADVRARLADELGMDPSQQLTDLHQAILRQDPHLAAPSAPVTSAARPSGNLPAALSELIGREHAVAEVGHLVETARMVTLTGPGGVGKTRLAVRTGGELTKSFPDGVWLAELDAVAGPAEVIATALGVRDGAGTEPLVERLAGALRHKQALLVLDNCEQVVEEVAVLAETLLKAGPDLRILATSRQPLGVDGERLWVVPPLDQDRAAELFVARAAATAPGFVLGEDNAEAVAAICARLDGIPLALELAATRVRSLGVRQLADRLGDRFQVLAAGRRGAPQRQQTLRGMIDWSWELLADDERELLRRLAVFSGGCTLAAAETVCAGDDVLDLLARLVDRSLVVTDGRDSADGPRYRLLESVAAYAMERLEESGEVDRVQRAHFEYFTAFAEQAQPHLLGHGQRQWLRLLDAEIGNLHGALDGAVRQKNAAVALRLANATAWYRYLRGRWGAARRALDLALGIDGPAPDSDRATAEVWRAGAGIMARDDIGPFAEADVLRRIGDPVRRARAEWYLEFARIGFGDPESGDQAVHRILAVFRGHADRWGTAATLTTRAWNALARSDLAKAADDAGRAVALFGELGDSWGRMQAMDVLGEVAQITGDYPRAARLHRDGLRVAEDLGLWRDVSYKLAQLGRIALLSGDYPRAEEFHERARRLAAEQSDRFGEQFAEIGLALAARRQGRMDEAEAHLDGWLDWYREIGWAPGVALVYAERGFIAESRGDAKTALDLHRAGFAAAKGTSDPRAVALAVEGIAGALSLAGDATVAARLLGAAGSARQAAGAPLPSAERGDIDRITERTRELLGEPGFTTEYERGSALSAAGLAAELMSTMDENGSKTTG
ncbi:BTAD domain-containing putative transcriptional regulator [Kibdelosporangium phytohabitans]|uniref:BTAD domain-containing putative transcriptional regulator n=1 Tax=Kibdelosporangium phytohabitans TaxID=860235 RepID=UPI0007C6C4BB|nr:BTAD domain-containing putative transcriptional regulator [Kibdelosporangium phytohabitans]MBE1469411.1 putative ATPase/DNA-binding SARP family transcriptional activator [Kibdelosporangium phytohabitans]